MFPLMDSETLKSCAWCGYLVLLAFASRVAMPGGGKHLFHLHENCHAVLSARLTAEPS